MAKTSAFLARAAPAPQVFLAPMSGVTDAPFREAVRAFGVGTLVSEMVACRALLGHMRDTGKLNQLFDRNRATVLQLVGTEPEVLAHAVTLAAGRGAAAIDLNFGCPARKVVGKAAGSALMRTPDLSKRIFAAVGAAAAHAKLAWSVKMRLGWDERSLNAATLARAAVEEGARLITVHARTRCQFYKGRADWRAVRAVVQAVGVPVIVNGDLATPAEVAQALRDSGAAGYMIGRAAIGRPWILKALARPAALPPWQPGFAKQAKVHRDLLDTLLVHHGRGSGLKAYRKHLAAWLPPSHDDRRDLLTCPDPDPVLAFLDRAA